MQATRWYLQRLSVSTPWELPHRFYRMTRDYLGKFYTWPEAKNVRLEDVWIKSYLISDFRTKSIALPFDLDHFTSARWPAEWRDACISDAEQLLTNPFLYLSLDKKPSIDKLDWNFDCHNMKSMPLDYGPLINFRNPLFVGDVKSIWDLNRQQHLVRLAQAYWLSRDERFAQEVVSQVASWIEQCPNMKGINWASQTVSAKRLISWTLAFEFIKTWQGLSDDFISLWIKSVYQHLDFITKHYSFHSSAHNHLIAEASGCYVASAYWHGLKKSNTWKRQARSILIRECACQNWSDGVNKEQSFGYHMDVFDMLLFPALVGQVIGEPFPQAYTGRLEKMAEFVAWIVDCQCHMPRVGDGDDKPAYVLANQRDNPIRSLLNTAAIMFSRADFKTWAGGVLDEKTAWLFGQQGRKVYQSLGPVLPTKFMRQTRGFSQGGYYVFRSGSTVQDEAVLLFDCGPLGYPATAGHGHADALSITLNVAGEELIVDPGSFNYIPGKWRRYFKSTAQHNTLSFDQENQSEYLDTFMWGRKSHTELLSFSSNGSQAYAQGRVNWFNGAFHLRTINWDSAKKRIQIDDKWSGNSAPTISFCLSPTSSLKLQIDKCRAIVSGQKGGAEIFVPGHYFRIERAYTSPRFRKKVETKRVCVDCDEKVGQCRIFINWYSK